MKNTHLNIASEIDEQRVNIGKFRLSIWRFITGMTSCTISLCLTLALVVGSRGLTCVSIDKGCVFAVPVVPLMIISRSVQIQRLHEKSQIVFGT